MFAALLSATVVVNALPRIVTELGGSQSSYTWVVVASLLTMTTSAPVWGKLADLYDNKVLLQAALLVFVLGSLASGFAPGIGVLIASRAVQGIGMGGLSTLVQIVIARMVVPRLLGRYSGYTGAVYAVATLGGPLVGGVIVDTPALGWRWCFWIGVVAALPAFVVVHRTIHLARVRRTATVDYAGAVLIVVSLSCLLALVSLAGVRFAWVSAPSIALAAVGLLGLVLAVLAEARATDPIVPLRLFRDRTTILSVFASASVGAVMFSATVFMTQYFQLARGLSPTVAGLTSITLAAGSALAGIASGRVIARTGHWKAIVLTGLALTTAGVVLLGTIDSTTPIAVVLTFMTMLGVGMGMCSQHLVLVVQNAHATQDLGATSSLVNLARSVGGSIGVTVFGSLLASRVAATLGESRTGRALPDPAALSTTARQTYQAALGSAFGEIFLALAPVCLHALVLGAFLPRLPLRTAHTDERDDDRAPDAPA